MAQNVHNSANLPDGPVAFIILRSILPPRVRAAERVVPDHEPGEGGLASRAIISPHLGVVWVLCWSERVQAP